MDIINGIFASLSFIAIYFNKINPSDTMQKSSIKNSLIKVSVGTLLNSGGTVAKGLMDLQREMKGLDSSVIDFTKKAF